MKVHRVTICKQHHVASQRTWRLACVVAALTTAPVADAEDASRWPYEMTAGKFRCHATFDLAGHQPLFRELAQLEQDVSHTLGIPHSDEPMHVYLFGNQLLYRQYLGQYFPAVPYRRALFVKNRGPGMVFAHLNQEFAVDLRHESTHAVLHSSLPMVPLWLDEGLAEYFEAPQAERASGNPHLNGVKWAVRFGRVPSLEQLEAKADLSEMDRGDYRNSWAWTHFMLHGSREAHDELVSYLADIRASTPPGVLSERLRRRVPDMDRRFLDHFRNWR
ncbi:MAG: DUF1570 domain-containing protein [Planctomycetales bacterium]|nr:DUF1570 domain-containing protein [Planctomycetales bacterium]